MSWKKLFLDHSGVGHLKGMAVIGGAALVVLLLAGKPFDEAIVYAIVLACPLMMVGMMFGGHQGHGSDERVAGPAEVVTPAPVAGGHPGRSHVH
jgi:hypothetical protein